MSHSPQRATPDTAGVGAPKTMSIVGLVLSILTFTSLIGLIVSILAFRKAQKAGYRDNIALVGIIIGAIVTIGVIASWFVFGSTFFRVCSELGSGVHQYGSTKFTCP